MKPPLTITTALVRASGILAPPCFCRRAAQAGVGLLFLSLAVAGPAAEPVRVAILPASSDFTAAADLLATSLSAVPGVTLVEREQIQKVWREQELAAGQLRPGFIKLGRLLNADGLLSLESGLEGTNSMLAVRLIAVKPGVVLAEDRFPMPLKDPVDWGNTYPKQIERLLPKLAIKAEDAVPISILNLRSSVSTSDGLALEKELTTLMQFRLAHEPAVFVLERRRMEQLESEKQLATGNSEPFWNGAYVLDGVINRDVVSRETVMIHARLAPRRGAATELEVSGRRAELRSVVDELTRNVLAAIGKAVESQPWRPEIEAERFAKEALWDWSWGRLEQTAEAADASWALGRHTRLVAALRVVPRGWLGFSMRGPLDYQWVDPYGFRPPPTTEALPLLTQALQLYSESFQEFAAETNGPGTAWASVGLEALLATARVLERYHARLEFCEGHQEELIRVRHRAREVDQLLATNRFLGRVGWGQNLEGLPRILFVSDLVRDYSLCEAEMDAGGLWFDKPAEAVEECVKMFRPELYPALRSRLFSRNSPGLPIPAWSFSDRQARLNLSKNFIEQMASSTNAQIRLDGWRWLLEQSQDPETVETAARRMLDEAWTARDSIMRSALDAPVGQVLTNAARRVAAWGRPSSDMLLGLADGWSQRFRDVAPDLSYEIWEDYVRSVTNSRIRTVRQPSIPPRPERVRALIEQFETLRGGQNGGLATAYLSDLKRSAGLPDTAASAAPTKPTRMSQVAALPISRRWSLRQLAQREVNFGEEARARNLAFEGGRLWFETRTYAGAFNGVGRPAFAVFDPGTMRTELIETPFDGENSPFPEPRRSLVVGTDFFVSADSSLWRRDGRGEWRRFEVPASGRAVPYLWNKKLVLSAEQSILAFDLQTGEASIMASTRRNPAVNALDRAGGLGKAPLAVWPGGQLCALADRKVWTYDDKMHDWRAIISVTNCNEGSPQHVGVPYGNPALHLAQAIELHPTGAFYRQFGQCGLPVLGGWRPGANQLTYYACEQYPLPMRESQSPSFTPPLWLQPEDCHPFVCSAAFDGPNVWVFPNVAPKAHSITVSSSNLVVFDRRFWRGLELRLELAGRAGDLITHPDVACPTPFRSCEFLLTPLGLAILTSRDAHLLWIPKADLDRALAEAAKLDPQPERWDWAGLRRFDREHKGWLDEAEQLRMRQDAAWQAEEKASLETARKATLARHGPELDAMFTQADLNQDGKLSPSELEAAVVAHQDLLAERLRGVNVPLIQAMAPCDLDLDLAYNLSEFRAFASDPRLLAELNLTGPVSLSEVVSQKPLGQLVVARDWSVDKAQFPRGRSLAPEPYASHLVWHHGRLWVETATRTNLNSELANPTLVALDPATMQSESFIAPFDVPNAAVGTRRSVLMDNQPFVCGEGALWHRDAGGGWHRLPVPVSGTVVPYAWGGRVLLSAEHSILEVDPQTAQARVLASNGRNPPVTALDRVAKFGWPTLAIWPGNQLCALVGGQVWSYDPARGDWLVVYSATNCGEALELQSAGAIYRQSGVCGPRLVGGLRPGSSVLEFYTWEPTRTSGLKAPNPSFTPPVWTHPPGSLPHAHDACFDGPNLWIFPTLKKPDPGAATASVAEDLKNLLDSKTNRLSTRVLYLDRRFLSALELDFSGVAGESGGAFAQAQSKEGTTTEFLPCPDGLAILIREGGLVSWIPKASVEQAVANALKAEPQPERYDLFALRRFDAGGKGWLTDAERRKMRTNGPFQQELRVARDLSAKAALSRHGSEWDTLFAEADANHDGKLSGTELEAVMAAQPKLFAEKLLGLNDSMVRAMRPYALEADYAYTLAEFRAFASDPRPLAEVNLSVDWVRNFGLKPEECDLNDDGIIDSTERDIAKNLIRHQSDKTSAKKP